MAEIGANPPVPTQRRTGRRPHYSPPEQPKLSRSKERHELWSNLLGNLVREIGKDGFRDTTDEVVEAFCTLIKYAKRDVARIEADERSQATIWQGLPASVLPGIICADD